MDVMTYSQWIEHLLAFIDARLSHDVTPHDALMHAAPYPDGAPGLSLQNDYARLPFKEFCNDAGRQAA